MPATARFILYLSRGFPRTSTSFGSSDTSSFNWARYAPAVTMSISHRLWSSKSLGTPETKSTPQPTPNFPEKHQVETTELHVEKHPLDTEEWSRVYRFPYIVAVHRLIRLKLYQTVASVLTVPPIMWAYYTQTITIDQASCMVGITTTAVVFLYIAGHLSERFIGAVYENQGKDKVRLAHLTFFGHRKDIIVDSNDIMDLSDVDAVPDIKFDTITLIAYRFALTLIY
ncbi:transmembrane protein 186-like isoform X2 [Varroa jacobsoni]|uniref:transmembrane protein 186-like isoform X2 n=1 Tax=Varroa jacobsoni TaxID=62625 RepID=UPI000BF32F3D|nr:transmembrane protein 186-like isoform X2 [Varroa jacobsoni]